MPVPGYPKVVAYGTFGTESVLKGKVSVQEKVDGSQFGFGVEEGKIVFRSHGQAINPDCPPSMFKGAVDHIMAHQDWLCKFTHEVYMYGEVVNKPKHNVLTYTNVPLGNVVLFDVFVNGYWAASEILSHFAEQLGISYIPPLFEGEITEPALLQMLEDLSNHSSALGGTIAEGLVIKNYSQFFEVGGHVWPIFVKLVRPQFKEQHAATWGMKGGPGELEKFVNSFKNDQARWQKAVQALDEQGTLKNAVQDIGPLCAVVQDDIEAEEKEAIKEGLWKLYGKDFKRSSVAGLAEWYKRKLFAPDMPVMDPEEHNKED